MTRRVKGGRCSKNAIFVRLSMKNQCQRLGSDNKPKFQIAFPSYRHFAVIQALACPSTLSSRQFVAYPSTSSARISVSLPATHTSSQTQIQPYIQLLHHRCSYQSDPRHPVTLSFKSSAIPSSRTSNRRPASLTHNP